MIEVVKFQAEHYAQIHEQSGTVHLRPNITEAHLGALAALPHSYTVLAASRPIACGGVIEMWPGRAEAWAVLDATCRRDFMAVHNAARRFLDLLNIRRVEAVVEVGFAAGHRWLRALGFHMEAPRMLRYGWDGRDYSLYARIH